PLADLFGRERDDPGETGEGDRRKHERHDRRGSGEVRNARRCGGERDQRRQRPRGSHAGTLTGIIRLVGAVISRPGEGERFERGDHAVTIKAALTELSVNEIAFDSTFDVSPHTHDDHVDAFYVLEGTVEFTLGDQSVQAGPGTFVAISTRDRARLR